MTNAWREFKALVVYIVIGLAMHEILFGHIDLASASTYLIVALWPLIVIWKLLVLFVMFVIACAATIVFFVLMEIFAK